MHPEPHLPKLACCLTQANGFSQWTHSGTNGGGPRTASPLRQRLRTRLPEATNTAPPLKVMAHVEDYKAKVPHPNHKLRMFMSLVHFGKKFFSPKGSR